MSRPWLISKCWWESEQTMSFFKLDSSMERGSRILSIMDELGLDDTKDV